MSTHAFQALSSICTRLLVLMTTLRRKYHHPHSSDEDSMVQERELTRQGCTQREWAGLGFKPKLPDI